MHQTTNGLPNRDLQHRLWVVGLVFVLLARDGLARAPLDEVPWGASLESAQAVLASLCMADRLYSQHPVVSPLAQAQEQHYLCLGFRHETGIVDKVVFVFADDALVHMEARGNALRAFAPLHSPIERYFDYVLLAGGQGYASPAEDVVWFMSPAAHRSGLIPLPNPYVAGQKVATGYAGSVQIPPAMTLGSTLEQALPALRRACPRLEVNRNSVQVHVSCLGYEFAGFPRRLAITFEQGRLVLIRVSIGQGEQDRVSQALRKAYGEPDARSQDHQSYSYGRVVLNQRDSELLLLSRNHPLR